MFVEIPEDLVFGHLLLLGLLLLQQGLLLHHHIQSFRSYHDPRDLPNALPIGCMEE
jgi:hypothetical protein